MIFFYFRKITCVTKSKLPAFPFIPVIRKEEEEISVVVPGNARMCVYQYELGIGHKFDYKFVNYVCNKRHITTDCKFPLPDNCEANDESQFLLICT